MLERVFKLLLNKWVSKLIAEIKAELAAGQRWRAIALSVFYFTATVTVCVPVAQIFRIPLYTIFSILIATICAEIWNIDFEDIIERLSHRLLEVLRNYLTAIKERRERARQKPKRPSSLFNWAANRLPEEYRRHFQDYRKQWIEEGCSHWVIQFKTAGLLLATYWAIFIIWLQNIVSRNRAV